MGFEYKIKATLTTKNVMDIKLLLESKETFDKKYKFQGHLFWDLKKAENNGEIPNTSILFKEDGLDIIQWISSNPWEDLQELKHYLEKEHIEYRIIDYQE